MKKSKHQDYDDVEAEPKSKKKAKWTFGNDSGDIFNPTDAVKWQPEPKVSEMTEEEIFAYEEE